MSRHDPNLSAAGEATEVAELLDALAAEGVDRGDRFLAMAQCLSGGSGWRDAAKALGGTFGGFSAVTGLMPTKEE